MDPVTGMVAPFPVLGYILIGVIVFGLGIAFGIIVYRAMRQLDSPDVFIDKLLKDRSDLRRRYAEAKVEREDISHDLEREHEHSHRLVTDFDYYRRHATLGDRVTMNDLSQARFDARV